MNESLDSRMWKTFENCKSTTITRKYYLKNSYEEYKVFEVIYVVRMKFENLSRWPDMKISRTALKLDCHMFIFALSSLSSFLLIRGFDSANSLSFGEGYDVDYHHHAGIVFEYLYRWKGNYNIIFVQVLNKMSLICFLNRCS